MCMKWYGHHKRKKPEEYKDDFDFEKWINAWIQELDSFWELF